MPPLTTKQQLAAGATNAVTIALHHLLMISLLVAIVILVAIARELQAITQRDKSPCPVIDVIALVSTIALFFKDTIF